MTHATVWGNLENLELWLVKEASCQRSHTVGFQVKRKEQADPPRQGKLVIPGEQEEEKIGSDC